jgi:eukaryotic-like serine/threonine-protein kinase
MALNIGDTIGDYQVIGILGAGGMGKVYKVRNIISDRVEAMKVLLPDLAHESELADRFVREIKLLASLDHPNIAALHTALRLENQLLMVMEFVEGETIESRLQQGPMPPQDAVPCVMQVLSALSYAHERGVIHRDIKPANMMVTPNGGVKLMDFGIAKAAADRRLTMTGTTMGSLYYMSPEQVKGSAGLDARADIYSVGVSLYEMVTGTRPFKGDSDYAIMAAHLEKVPVPPIQVDPKLPPALNEIILVAIQKDPADRFQSAQAFRGALESVGGSLGFSLPQPAAAPTVPVQSGPVAAAVPPAPAPAKSGGYRGLYMALGALVALAVLVVTATQLPKMFKARAGSDQTSVPVTATQPSPAPLSAAPATTAPVTETVPQAAPTQALAPTAAVPSPAAPAAGSAPARTAGRSVTSAPARGFSSSGAAPPPAAVSVPVQAANPAPPAAAPAVASGAPAVDAAAVQAQRERIIQMAARANAVRGSLQNIERRQQATGVGLRGDISASWKRMEYMMDEAENALKSRDAAAAKRNLDGADRDLEKLEQFLGR